MSGWITTTVGDACEVVNGGTPKTGVAEFWGGPHQWVTPAEMGKRASPYIGATERTLSDAGIANSSARALPPNSVILSSRAPIGHLVINTVPMAFNQGCKGLIPKSGLDHKFLYYYLFANVDLLNALGTGATFKELSAGKLKEVPLPVPPLAEQKRIVAILDDAFEGIAKATANAERNLANVAELFGSKRVLALVRATSDCATVKLGEHVHLLTGFAFKSAGYTNEADGVALLRGDNVVQGELRWKDAKRWPISDVAAYSEYQLANDDIVLAMDRTWVKAGIKFARIAEDDLPALLVQRVARLRCRPSLSVDYLFHLLGSAHFSDYVLGIQTGLGVPHISGKQIESFTFQLPTIAEQRRIAEGLDRFGAHCQDAAKLYQRELECLSELKQALLFKAFSGQLTGKEAVAA